MSISRKIPFVSRLVHRFDDVYGRIDVQDRRVGQEIKTRRDEIAELRDEISELRDELKGLWEGDVRLSRQNQTPSANPEAWTSSQEYELRFWREEWPYRKCSVGELQEIRHGDCVWFLSSMGFKQSAPDQFAEFTGKVLEAGSGPIGFFEKLKGVDVTAQDTLMTLYAKYLPFSSLGQRGATTYVPTAVSDITDIFDFVVCSNVLDHTADWIAFLEECSRRLKPGGELLLFTDSRGAPAPGHTQVFSPNQLRAVLRLLGAKNFPVDLTKPSDNRHCDFVNTIRAQF